jgi:hypothetical protein
MHEAGVEIEVSSGTPEETIRSGRWIAIGRDAMSYVQGAPDD